ncbi:MAG: hypothetical protein JKY34_09790, partial [Kordiimonadaceae bacterium]|nr:hypothetical protein [Kordiimonadaceae bacterium]
TPYVQSKDDLKALLDNLREVLIFFQQELGGEFMSVTEVYNRVSAQNAPNAPNASNTSGGMITGVADT